ncbi:hypothetical protein [Facklamia sp. P9177]|uniref:hypothetical protein n=1 Tax=Facklamia sp. P9177 TaxID=3421945 RepID=UPI003D16FEE0
MKKLMVEIGLKFLVRGLIAAAKVEPAIQKELGHYADGFLFELTVLNTSTKVFFEKRNDGFNYLGKHVDAPADLSIIFKSYRAAQMLILGQIGLHQGYAQHRFIVKGDFLKTMPLVRILYYVEAYLFPNFISKNILKEQPVLSASKGKAYFHLVF